VSWSYVNLIWNPTSFDSTSESASHATVNVNSQVSPATKSSPSISGIVIVISSSENAADPSAFNNSNDVNVAGIFPVFVMCAVTAHASPGNPKVAFTVTVSSAVIEAVPCPSPNSRTSPRRPAVLPTHSGSCGPEA